MLPETERLYLRPFTNGDLQNIYYLCSDPGVMKYIRPPVQTLKEAQLILDEKILPYYQSGNTFGVWATIIKGSEEFAGFHLLKDLDGSAEIELGYRLMKNSLGKGYATEMGKALIQYGFEECSLKKIAGITHPQNFASQHVLLKCGMKFEKEIFCYDTHNYCYAIYQLINSISSSAPKPVPAGYSPMMPADSHPTFAEVKFW